MRDAKLTDDILSILVRAGGRIVISDLLSSLQPSFCRGSGRPESNRVWRRLGTLHDFARLVETLGFVVFHSRNDRGQSGRFVGIEEMHPYEQAGPSLAAEGAASTGYVVRISHPRRIGFISRYKVHSFIPYRDLSDAKVWKTATGARKAGEREKARYDSNIVDFEILPVA